MEKLKEKIVEALFPALCVSCKKASDNLKSPWLCVSCASNLRPRLNTFCHVCGKDKGLGLSRSCVHKPPALSSVTTVFLYEDVQVRRIIHALKYYFLLDTLEILETALVKQKTDIFRLDTDYLVPLPLHKRKMRERGFNQAELIAQLVSKIIKRPVATDVLFKKRSTAAQMKIKTPKKRAQNVYGSFGTKNEKKILGKNILLVDDVVTTGSTLEEAARTLKTVGAKSVRAFVLARD